MFDELQKLVGKTFKPHELDNLCAKITGGQKEFRRLYWEDIVGLENMSYQTKLGVTYVVEFNLYKDEGEYDSILEVWEVNELDRNAHNRNFDKLYLILIAVLIFAVSIYYLFSFFH